MNVLSFGGGVQTTALALMVLEGAIERPDVAIFADTQWETKDTYEYVDRVERMWIAQGLKFIRVTVGDIRNDSLSPKKRWASMPLFTLNNGVKGMLMRQCTNEYKIQPIIQGIRRFIGLKPRQRMKHHINMWLGITTDEAHRMKDNRIKWITNVYPLIERKISRRDCKNYLKPLGFGDTPKSACIGCPYHSDNFWRSLKEDSPDEFANAVEYDNDVRKTRVALKSPVFLHRSCKPLGEVKLDREPDLFGNECEGLCGL